MPQVYSSDMLLRLCPECRRHVTALEHACPFCGTRLSAAPARPPTSAARLGRAAVFAGATALAGTACWTDAKTPRTTPIEDKKPVETKLAAPPPGTIRGVIRNGANGAPLPGVSVTIEMDGGPRYATSNQQGIYEFTGLPPGSYEVEWHSGNPRESPQLTEVTLGQDAGAIADINVYFPEPDTGPCCKPYGAPPARRRIV